MFNPFDPSAPNAKICQVAAAAAAVNPSPAIAFPSPGARLQVTKFVQRHRDLAAECCDLWPLLISALEICHIPNLKASQSAGCDLRQLISLFGSASADYILRLIFGDL